jgi:hypothetical protein
MDQRWYHDGVVRVTNHCGRSTNLPNATYPSWKGRKAGTHFSTLTEDYAETAENTVWITLAYRDRSGQARQFMVVER